jgi:hypothetical protein
MFSKDLLSITYGRTPLPRVIEHLAVFLGQRIPYLPHAQVQGIALNLDYRAAAVNAQPLYFAHLVNDTIAKPAFVDRALGRWSPARYFFSQDVKASREPL